MVKIATNSYMSRRQVAYTGSLREHCHQMLPDSMGEVEP